MKNYKQEGDKEMSTLQVNIRKMNLGRYLVPEEVKGGVCVDIGANVGSFTEKYKDYFSLINFYEPFIGCYNVCFEKFKNNKNIIGYNEAVYSEKTTHYLVRHENKDSGSSALNTEVVKNTGWNPEEVIQEVRCVDLETVLKRVGGEIDFLKCDCETSEYFIFKNKDLSKINFLAIELHCQLGPEKFSELTSYIRKTHDLIYGSDSHTHGKNSECMYRRREGV